MRRALLLAAVLVAPPAGAEVFVDVGVQSAEHEAKIADVDTFTTTDSSLHLGVGVRRDVGARGSIGARLELDEVDESTFIAVRAFDYAFHFSDRFAFTAFAGAARLNLRTPAYGYYLGAGLRLKDFTPRWDLGLDFRVGDKLARDNREPEDPGTIGLANFHDVTSVSLYTSYRFGGGPDSR